MTEALYLEDSYQKEFEAKVEEANGKFVVLVRTAFYPLSGGQPSDTGVLITQGGEKYDVLFAKKIGNNISHEVDREGLSPGTIVEGKIDWDKRYRLMRYHTAAHILAAVIHDDTNAKITGNQITLSKARIDFNLEDFDREKIRAYMDKVNSIIAKELPVLVENMSREKAFEIPSIIKLKDLLPPAIDTIRVITIPDVDRQACGGTHVANTKEIGPIQIVKAENKGANNRRIYFSLLE